MANEHYIINTFETESNRYYDIAIKFYIDKTNALLENLKMQNIRELMSTTRQLDNIEEIFKSGLKQMEAGLKDFETLYNMKISGAAIQERIAKFNEKSHFIEEGLEKGFETAKFFEILTGGKLDFSNRDTQLPQTIDLSAQRKVLETFAKRGYENAAAAGGARARLMGEIMEQLAVSLTREQLGSLFQSLEQTGAFQTRSFNARLASGKSDMLFVEGSINYNKLDSGETVGNINGQTVELDLAEALDLSGDNVQASLERYYQNEKSLIGGMTIKQWSNKMLGKTAATFAHSSYTQGLINERFPNHTISEYFSNKNVFRLYTAYIISRFLINVIGVYNILVSNSSEVAPTYTWLQNLKAQKYLLQHEIKLQDSIYIAKDTISVGKF